MYKVAGLGHAATGAKPTDTEYLYLDSAGAARSTPLALSNNRLDGRQGAVQATLAQLIGASKAAQASLGWFYYNDQYPPGKVVGNRGHTKGVLAFNLDSDSGFWLVHSTPNFVRKGAYAFPPTGHDMGQSYLCITLPSAAVAKKIAEVMYVAHQPNVYAASAVP